MHNTPTLLNTPPRRNQLDVLEDIAGGIGDLVEAGGGAGGGPDRELAIVQYRVKTAFTGASVGDTITSVRVLDVGGATPTQVGATIWYNESTGAPLASAPAAANLEPQGASGITNAQMTALLVGMATAALQTAGNASLATLVTSSTPFPATQGLQTTGNTSLASILTRANLLSTEATLAALSGKLPATLGAKAGAASLAVVPATDASFVITGNIADGAADAGNTVKVGGVYQVAPTLAAGQRSALQLDSRGSIKVAPMFQDGTSSFTGAADNADGAAVVATSTRVLVLARNTVYNALTNQWDRAPGDATGAESNVLKRPAGARKIVVGAASVPQALTANVKRISIKARGCDMRYVLALGTTSADAATGHFIEAGERLDMRVPDGVNPFIAAIADSTVGGTGWLEITELT